MSYYCLQRQEKYISITQRFYASLTKLEKSHLNGKLKVELNAILFLKLQLKCPCTEKDTNLSKGCWRNVFDWSSVISIYPTAIPEITRGFDIVPN